MAYYGLMSVSFPVQAGSTGMVWGASAVLWAVAFVVVAEYSHVGTSATFRRTIAQESTSPLMEGLAPR